MVARKVNATTGPTPGIVIRRRHTSSSRTMTSKRRCNMPSCSRRTCRTMSNGSTNSATSGRFSTSSLTRASNLTVPSTPTLRNFGLKVGVVGTVKFEARVRELVENLPDVAELVEPLLIVRQVLRQQLGILHRRLLAIVRDDDVCRRLMTIPGVGPVVALTYRATVDVPIRFRKSKSVGAVFGLTCAKYRSGEIDRTGAISRCGDQMVRTTLYEAAQILLVRSTKWSWLKAWAMQIARRRGMKRAIVALARRLAVIMHRIYGPA